MPNYPYDELDTKIDRSFVQGLNKNFDEVEQDINGVIAPMQALIEETTNKDVISAPEIIAARDGKSNLATRLGTDYAEVTARLAQAATVSEVDVERRRIDSFVSLPEGSTTGNSELLDIRVDSEGVTYENAGNSIRTNFKKIYDQLKTNGLITDMLAGVSLQNGYISAHGGLIADANWVSSDNIAIPANSSKIIMDFTGNSNVSYILFYGDTGLISKFSWGADSVKVRGHIINIPSNAKIIKVSSSNITNNFYTPFKVYAIKDSSKQINEVEQKISNLENKIAELNRSKTPLNNVLSKPYVFEGKSAFYMGDSITYGYSVDSGVAINNWVKLFNAKSKLLSTLNYAVSGSVFTNPGNHEYGTGVIIDQLKRSALTRDFLFIAGATNDYSQQVPLSQFEVAVREVCEYIKNNTSGKAIFIAPINRTSKPVNATLSLDDYRKVICELCIEYGFGFINGGLFHFPQEVNSLSSILFSDGVHLTDEKGNELYANELSTILL